MANFFLDNISLISKEMSKIFPQSVFYATDLEAFVYKDDTNFDVPFVKVGEKFAKGGVADKVIQNGQVSVMELDASFYGIPLKVTTLPIYDDDTGRVIGTFGTAIRRDNAFSLRQIADTYQKGMHEISAAIEETAAAAGDISSSEIQLNKEIIAIRDIAEEIRAILEYIRSIADETKMLGLNAAIEAARAGDAGKGFGVVAAEIRKLSESSKETANQIKELTGKIEDKISVALKGSEVSMRSSEEQAAATEEMTASIQELTSMIGEFTRIANEI